MRCYYLYIKQFYMYIALKSIFLQKTISSRLNLNIHMIGI